MIFIGMIYQYDNTQGTGLIMLSDGEKKEFSSNDWTDTVNIPSVGQKISYENDANGIQIKVSSEENIKKALADKEQTSPKAKNISPNSMEQFTSVDDCLNYFTDVGFKLVKDVGNDESRTLTLRSYAVDGPKEAIIKKIGSKVSVIQTLNGNPVPITRE